ncbi:MAG TPA: ABC transporter permease [Yinghuangia sp.]|nr:ABC transporter permease [Yinghuangia sp.]
MSAPVPAPPVSGYRSPHARGGAGFGRLLHAEWTKLRTVRRWGYALIGAVVLTVLVALLAAGGSEIKGGGPSGPTLGPNGRPVSDGFRFVHQPLTGDGTVTVRVDSLVAQKNQRPNGREGSAAPWAKAGLIMKASTLPGSTYAAALLTHSHGVRFQYDFTHDVAGSDAPPDRPRWLRLTRAGDVVTAYESADGVRWDKIGATEAPDLPETVHVGMFVASPMAYNFERAFGSTGVDGTFTLSTGTFRDFSVDGRTEGPPRVTDVGAQGSGPGASGDGDAPTSPAGVTDAQGNSSSESGGVHTIVSTGDIAPMEADVDLTQQGLSGAVIGLIPLAALGVLFITAEFRRGMIATTFTASPRRGRVLAAKAVVLGGTTFVAGAVAAAVAFVVSQPLLRGKGHRPPVYPELTLADGSVLRAVSGTALVLALVAVLALAVGALVRNTAASVTVIVVLLVLPQILVAGLPLGAARLVVQATPAAGFAVQRTIEDFPQVESACLPEDGCYPQGAGAGLAVLCVYVAVALGLAVWQLRRRRA